MTTNWMWQPLLDGMVEAVWLIDPIDLRIVAANQAAAAMLKMDHGELIGKNVIDLAATPEDLFFWEEVAAGSSTTIHSETMLLLGDGSTIPVDRRVTQATLSIDMVFYLVAISSRAEQRRVEQELECLLAELRATLESTADGILVTDNKGRIRSFNHRFAELWEIPEKLMMRRNDDATLHWMARHVLTRKEYLSRLDSIRDFDLGESRDVVTLSNGTILERVSKPQMARGISIGRVYSFRDITQQLANQSRLQLAAEVFDSSIDAICVAGPTGLIATANPSFENLIGFSKDTLATKVIWDLVRASKHTDVEHDLRDEASRDNAWEGEVYCHRSHGDDLYAQASIVRVLSADQQVLHYVVFLKDLTEKMAAMQRIKDLAYGDALTGLPNRLLLNERIEHSINLCKREDKTFAVVFVDLDRFKQINDSLGHDFGDRVLVSVAQRITSCLRSSDIAARMGGDEFIFLLPDTDACGAEMIVQRVMNRLGEPLLLDSLKLTVTGSIGIALFPVDGKSKEDLIKNADTAMYQAKARGRSNYRFYQRQMNIDSLSRIKLDSAMRSALESGHFKVHYQPQVDLLSGEIVGAEALLRWTSKDLGSVSPAQFIPVAEETGFIVSLGHWVLKQAVEQCAQWQAKGMDLVVAINVSALQFRSSSFISDVSNALSDANLAPCRLELELTESILIQHVDETLAKLDALADLGVRISIDDFGTGYSSLGYLKRFPVHKLKIDRSFVTGLPDDESDLAIAQAIVSMGLALRLRVIAEGVETEQQRHCLEQLGCNEYQGFLMSGAVDSQCLEAMLIKGGERPLIATT